MSDEALKYKNAFEHCNDICAKQSALLAQMAAALEECKSLADSWSQGPCSSSRLVSICEQALTAYTTMSPDPQWQRVPEGCVVVQAMDIRNMAFLAQRDEKATGIGKTIICTNDAEKLRGILDKILKRARGEG